MDFIETLRQNQDIIETLRQINENQKAQIATLVKTLNIWTRLMEIAADEQVLSPGVQETLEEMILESKFEFAEIKEP